MKKFSRLILVFTLVFFLVACGSSDDNVSKADEKDKDLIFGLITWPENIAVNYIWKVLLEEKGYNVELNQLDMGIIMESLHTGDLDVGMEVWLPIQDINYYEKYKDTVDFNETPWFTNGKVGLAVPDYLDEINSVEDLNEHKDLFDGEIIGFEPGAGTMDTTDLLIEDYDLDYELVASSEGAMVAAIKDAFDNEEPIVAPLWQPHGIFSDVDLKFLEDPKETYGEVEEIFLAKRDGFAEDYPEVNEWLTNWSIDDDEIMAELINFVNEDEDHYEGAKKWVEENR
ncbi:MAG TPA: glycine betaine ABC transporter substrate-binding protein, partial [Pseudogracilibacillus sp.]|nr:glycine betaine ABC transporter substrate-binding protein [Pseudogracilibacillus sp.]